MNTTRSIDKSGYKFKLNFDPAPDSNSETKKQGRQRKRSIIWFSPPYSRGVATNVGKQFLQIMDKHFPPGNPLHQIFNRNKVKMSYRCTPNLGRKISAHNSEILNPPKIEDQRQCDCRKSAECPVQGKCLQEGVIYQATIRRGVGQLTHTLG